MSPESTPAPPPTSHYRMPPPEVAAIVDAPPPPQVILSPDGQQMLLARYDALPSIASVAQPFERLAGLRIDAKRYAARRTRLYLELTLRSLADGTSRPIDTPPAMKMAGLEWSPDGSRIAFFHWGEDALDLWVADARTGQAKVVAHRLTEALGPGYVWMPHGRGLLVWEREPEPLPPRSPVPAGPQVEDTKGRKATVRTYQDLLETPDDDARFAHLATAQLVHIDLVTGERSRVGKPDLVLRADPSPDGRFILVTRLERPFSHAVPYHRFARVIEVVSRTGELVYRVARQPAAEEIPIGGVRVGPRMVDWHAQQPASLHWVEALDEGDPRVEVPKRDRVVLLPADFDAPPTELLRTEHRLRGLSWTGNRGQALVREYDRDRRWTTTWVYDFARGEAPRKLIDRSIRDAYGDPGRPLYTKRPDTTVVAHTVDEHVFLAGSGASPTGERPFVDRVSLASGDKQRLFESGTDEHAEFVDFVLQSPEQPRGTILIRRESPTEVPNYVLVRAEGKEQVTEFDDPHPQLTGIDKQILRYKRADGVELSGTLYLPPGTKKGQRLPLVVWAYPREYNDQGTAGQVRAAPRRFTRLRGTSPLMFLTQGYAVLDRAAMPIVGDPETMNDTFIEQVVSSAQAAVDAVVEAGVADRDRVGIGGHSYGAFMAANLLAHSDLFQAGIARSGAYNRSLTPFGFQSERRTLWEATPTYVEVSPLFAADKIDEPILLIHGAVDNNPGTYPLQSRRLYHALAGTGGTARLVVLPHESHGYVARESVMHVLAESIAWFDTHVARRAP